MEIFRIWWRARHARLRLKSIQSGQLIAELSLLEQRVRRLERVRSREALEQIKARTPGYQPEPAFDVKVESAQFGGGA